MKELELYQEMLIESAKRRINAEADERNALDELFALKMNYIKKKIKQKTYVFEGIHCKPASIDWREGRYGTKEYWFEFRFAAIPEILRDNLELTKTEKGLLKKYEENVYNKIDFNNIVKNNKAPLDFASNWLYWDMRRCKNDIKLTYSDGLYYGFEKITSSGFVEERLILSGCDMF